MNLYAIIVTFNGEVWIRKCLTSLINGLVNTTVVVVDNGSVDSTVDIIENEFSEVILFKQDENLGFGKANNIGISYALNQGAEYVFLLNQDAYVQEDTLSKLVEVSGRNRNFGIVSPVHLNWNGDLLEYYFGRFVAKNRKFYADYVLKRALDEIYEVPYVNAAAWLIPSKILNEIGGFDPIFYHYGEDNNYCQRLAFHEYKIGIVPESYVCHESKIRTEPKNFIFSDIFFKAEIKKLLVKYGDINREIHSSTFRKVKLRLLKLIFINLIYFKFKNVFGYFKQYRIFNGYYNAIELSRAQNIEKKAHYL